jgi:hypothetical protein
VVPICPTKSVSAVITNFNTWSLTERCVRALEQHAAGYLNPHSPDNVLSFGVTLRDSDIAISSLFWIARGGDGERDG